MRPQDREHGMEANSPATDPIRGQAVPSGYRPCPSDWLAQVAETIQCRCRPPEGRLKLVLFGAPHVQEVLQELLAGCERPPCDQAHQKFHFSFFGVLGVTSVAAATLRLVLVLHFPLPVVAVAVVVVPLVMPHDERDVCFVNLSGECRRACFQRCSRCR